MEARLAEGEIFSHDFFSGDLLLTFQVDTVCLIKARPAELDEQCTVMTWNKIYTYYLIGTVMLYY